MGIVTAVAWVGSLTGELLYAVAVAKREREKKKKKEIRLFLTDLVLLHLTCLHNFYKELELFDLKGSAWFSYLCHLKSLLDYFDR